MGVTGRFQHEELVVPARRDAPRVSHQIPARCRNWAGVAVVHRWYTMIGATVSFFESDTPSC
jgi:hypothetical protein